jgi:hypothetical protein
LEEELKKKKLLEEQKAQALQSPILSENPTRNSSVETAKSSGWNIKQRLTSYFSFLYKKQN